MLVDAVNHRDRGGATQTTVLGPFYVGEHKVMPHGTDISAALPGERLFVQSRVTDVEGKPLAGVAVDVWHADDSGHYDSQRANYLDEGASSRARFMTDADGRFFFRTILPFSYPVPTDGPVGELIDATRRPVPAFVLGYVPVMAVTPYRVRCGVRREARTDRQDRKRTDDAGRQAGGFQSVAR